jgi:hypothetical protein
MTEDRCETCMMWRRGFRSVVRPHEWVDESEDPTEIYGPGWGTCRIAPSTHEPAPVGRIFTQSRMHADDWCAQFQPIAMRETP